MEEVDSGHLPCRFRKLFVSFSSYTYINMLRRIDAWKLVVFLQRPIQSPQNSCSCNFLGSIYSDPAGTVHLHYHQMIILQFAWVGLRMWPQNLKLFEDSFCLPNFAFLIFLLADYISNPIWIGGVIQIIITHQTVITLSIRAFKSTVIGYFSFYRLAVNMKMSVSRLFVSYNLIIN